MNENKTKRLNIPDKIVPHDKENGKRKENGLEIRNRGAASEARALRGKRFLDFFLRGVGGGGVSFVFFAK